MTKMTVVIDADLMEGLTRLAKQECRSKTGAVNWIVKQAILSSQRERFIAEQYHDA